MKKEIVLPGLIDIHVHLRDLGQEQKETFETGTEAALAGGFIGVIDMPNKSNPIFSEEILRKSMEAAKSKTFCGLGFYFGTNGENLEEFEKVKGLAMGLKVYLNETTGNLKINLSSLAKIFKAWPEDAGPILLHAEEESVSVAIDVVNKIRRQTHFCHVSTKKDLEQIITAKEQGFPITCGVTPHHLFLTESDEKTLGGFGLMKPSLKTKEDQDFLWRNINQIDVIESDHAPHTINEKESENVPFGVPGLETTLPLLLTAVNEGKLKIEDIKRLCFTNPKQLLSSTHARWTFHNQVLVDLDEEWVIENKNLKTKSAWSPFNGRKVKGRVVEVYLHRKLVFKDGKILADPGSGQILTRNDLKG